MRSPDRVSRHFSMIRGFHLADFITLGNAACGVLSVLFAMLYMASNTLSHFVTLDTRTPHVLPFDGADANKTVTYWLRWVSTRGEVGPWSAAVSATVPG